MDEFFNIINPMVECFVDNFVYILIATLLYFDKHTRLIAISMILGFILWGFQPWIIIVCAIISLLILSFANIYAKYKTYDDDDK